VAFGGKWTGSWFFQKEWSQWLSKNRDRLFIAADGVAHFKCQIELAHRLLDEVVPGMVLGLKRNRNVPNSTGFLK
jgi:hypothetical protein